MNKKNVLWFCVVLTLSACVAAAQAAAPKRPMLEQGKTWTYVYHHFEDGETLDPDGVYGDLDMFFSWYTLKGDTIIDGLQYMKMYRNDERNHIMPPIGRTRKDGYIWKEIKKS